MDIVLKQITASDLLSSDTGNKTVFYGDFNVINHLYDLDIKAGKNLTIYPDSSAIYFTLKYLKRYKLKKIVSTDLQEEILKSAFETNQKVFFLGDSEEVLLKVTEKLAYQNKANCISGVYPGYNINSLEVIKRLQEIKPDILFVGLGAGRQEKWIIDHAGRMDIPLIISTGGWFRLLAGVNKRAPLWMRKIHLEWLYKLTKEYPRVWKRYIIGVPLFLYRIISNKIVLRVEG